MPYPGSSERMAGLGEISQDIELLTKYCKTVGRGQTRHSGEIGPSVLRSALEMFTTAGSKDRGETERSRDDCTIEPLEACWKPTATPFRRKPPSRR